MKIPALEKSVRAHALSYPEATEDHPWGETAIKVKGKMFVVWRAERNRMSMSVKIPHSRESALMLPFAQPTGYGLGKAGWVTLTFTGKENLPVGILKDWIDESYRMVAPKKLSAQVAAR
jgi:predicted DNA-binding protein (MmcQ/YjbR family)